ncbi:MAG: type II secretion system protein N, partial [Casimicrobiaceae bacterium]
MRAWLAVGAAALLLAAALAIEAPATLVDRRIEALTGGRVRIAGATGSVWRGSGELALLPDGVHTPITWRIDPMALLRGEVAASVDIADASRPAELTIGTRGDFAAQNLALTLPAAAALRAAGIPALLAAAGGTLVLEVASLARRGDRLDGRVTLLWQAATLPGPRAGTRIALGDVRLEAAGSGPQMPATLANSGGELDIAGKLVFTMRAMPQIDVHATPRAGIGAE